MSSFSRSAETLCAAFAHQSPANIYAISSRFRPADNGIEHTEFILKEAQAIAEFLEEREIRELTIVGHSQGGEKAIALAALLGDRGRTTVSGVVLIAAVGLYQQGSIELALRFLKHSFFGSLALVVAVATSSPREAFRILITLSRAAWDVVTGFIGEARIFGTSYFGRLKTEVREMAKITPNARRVVSPVVLIFGQDDPVSNPERICPYALESESKRRIKGCGTLTARESYLKEHLFPSRPHVQMLCAKRYGVHALPFLRPTCIAKVSLFLLKRLQRYRSK